MRRVLIALCLTAAFLLSGCAGIDQTGVQPGEGPAVSDEPTEGEADEPTELPSGPDSATFKDEYTHVELGMMQNFTAE